MLLLVFLELFKLGDSAKIAYVFYGGDKVSIHLIFSDPALQVGNTGYFLFGLVLNYNNGYTKYCDVT